MLEEFSHMVEDFPNQSTYKISTISDLIGFLNGLNGNTKVSFQAVVDHGYSESFGNGDEITVMFEDDGSVVLVVEVQEANYD